MPPLNSCYLLSPTKHKGTLLSSHEYFFGMYEWMIQVSSNFLLWIKSSSRLFMSNCWNSLISWFSLKKSVSSIEVFEYFQMTKNCYIIHIQCDPGQTVILWSNIKDRQKSLDLILWFISSFYESPIYYRKKVFFRFWHFRKKVRCLLTFFKKNSPIGA